MCIGHYPVYFLYETRKNHLQQTFIAESISLSSGDMIVGIRDLGGIVDGISTALCGNMTFTKGVPDAANFHKYRLIRMNEAPKVIDIHFVKNTIDPTGMGEPAYPPVLQP